MFFFFFFKQKTAYEMRISDWSSDVCSSDLALEPQIAGIYQRFGLNDRQIEIIASATPKRDYYCQSALGNRLFDLGLGPVAFAFAAASQRSDLNAISALIEAHGNDRFAESWLRHRGLGWAADIVAAERNPSPTRTPRSEEHTSELQSLMR